MKTIQLGEITVEVPDETFEALKKQLEQERKELSMAVQLLSMARCPIDGCDGNGCIAVQKTVGRQVGENEWVEDIEWEAEQCQWCDERNWLLSQNTTQEEVTNGK